jgi:hypothetical protein
MQPLHYNSYILTSNPYIAVPWKGMYIGSTRMLLYTSRFAIYIGQPSLESRFHSAGSCTITGLERIILLVRSEECRGDIDSNVTVIADPW